MSANLKGLLSLPEQAAVNRSKSDYEAIVLTSVNTVVRKLTLNYNKLVSLGSLHDHVPNLSYLSASNNQLTSDGTRQVHKFTKLVTLILSLNALTKLPRSLPKLPRLQALILNGNAISKLPTSFNVPTLSALVLSRNKIAQIPPGFLAGLPKLAKLSLSHNQLTEFPDVSANVVLQELRLNGNAIAEVPALEENTELTLLDVGTNKLRDGWDCVKLHWNGCRLKNLRYVHV